MLIEFFFLITRIIFSVVLFFYVVWIISSAREKEWRAFRRGLLGIVPFLTLIWAIFVFPHPWPFMVSILLCLGLFWIASIFLFPARRLPVLDDRKNLDTFDERDVIFSRWRYTPGTEIYETYYRDHPELLPRDDEIRNKPQLFTPGGLFYEPVRAAIGLGEFEILHGLSTLVDGAVAADKTVIDPNIMTQRLKEMIVSIGAHRVGITTLNPTHIYTHVGRGPEPWGTEIRLNHTHALVFTLEMGFQAVQNAPTMKTVVETGRRYVEGAIIAIIIANFIRSMGYGARAHMEGSNYQAILPPIAEEAGLGEIGRIGILMTPDLGPRVRLGLVTTDMPLISDKPVSFGAREFCQKCRKCADACPSGALLKGGKVQWRGTEMWRMNPEACYKTWRHFGSDCAICVSVCPYSKPDTLSHNIIRAIIKRSRMAQYLALWADDFFYGKGAHYLKRKTFRQKQGEMKTLYPGSGI